MNYPTVSLVKGMPINVTDHTVRMDYVEKYSIEPALPSTLHLDPQTGDISGVVNVEIVPVTES